jgi:hypothetical protein
MENGRGREVVSGGGDREADFDTRDLYLVAALLTMGIEPVGNEPVRIIERENLSGGNYQFFFRPVSECGKWRTRELLKYWIEGESWVEANPDHPFAHCIAFALNMKGVMKYVKGRAPYVFMRRGRGLAMLPLDASAELEEKILGHFPKSRH